MILHSSGQGERTTDVSRELHWLSAGKWCRHVSHRLLSTNACYVQDLSAVLVIYASTLFKGKADDLYRGSMQFENHRRTTLQYPLVHWTVCRCQQYSAFSMKALARYQVILLGEQRHIRCEQLPQGCCPNNAAVGVEPATSWSRVQRPTATLRSHLKPLLPATDHCNLTVTVTTLFGDCCQHCDFSASSLRHHQPCTVSSG